MSGYKRVNFYELCRLCATNQQKEKTHIFQEEGRKIQLQNKIQSCLSLKVCENDFLPKVVCSQCLRSLEECCIFRKECYTSETMLSSYFNNFRYTEDFKKSGKVYIKDTSPKIVTSQVTTENCNQMMTNANYNVNVISAINQETLPYYTLHFPTVVPQIQQSKNLKDTKLRYNVQTVLPNMPKNNVEESVALNNSGEIITITPLVDVDTLVTQNIMQKSQKRNHRKHKPTTEDNDIIKIDLTQSDFDVKEKLKTQQNKLTYSLDMSRMNFNLNTSQSVILNPASKLNSNMSNVSFPITSNVNIPTNSIAPTTEILNNTSQPPHSSTINLPTHSHHYSNKDTVNVNCNVNIADVETTLPNIFNNAVNSTPCFTSNNDVNTKQNFSIINVNSTFSTTTASVINQPAIASNLDTFSKQESLPIKKHTCDICCKTFKRREHLGQHIKLHTGFRPFKCENCNKSFMRKEHLLRHMTSHSGQKNFTCNICEKSFSRNDNLLKHKKIHNKQNSFTCEVCQKQFVMEHYYFAHKRIHESEKCNVKQVWELLKAM